MKRPLLLSAALIAAANLAACGLTGDLERPGPLWGDPKGDVAPADLPEQKQGTLPDLPDRPDEDAAAEEDADDELLGGT
ncbi:hypothetical protein HY29_15060 [Hyphomonas beringensis]|uniref:Argininosuccinate lyase n=1 Tax=Hyphomonas beringensis TaxID=1280946 RepID=A0A062U943_9PROT|nr:lipoprotein [Hyphomonas beringensis]KCZ54248.1 hypothetical protein HY29_15060 [Hyphomonas beringensis]